ncbi:MAG: DUF433 domain-containing protein [Flavobacteriia bacterium]|nr:DUF433 domain-containing protein [Flavobacteriia bacterium]
MELLKRITINATICHGKPCIRDMRYPVELILDLLSSGMTFEEIIDDYPELEKEDLSAALIYASRILKVKATHKISA